VPKHVGTRLRKSCEVHHLIHTRLVIPSVTPCPVNRKETKQPWLERSHKGKRATKQKNCVATRLLASLADAAIYGALEWS
jgi:hypothetical protein